MSENLELEISMCETASIPKLNKIETDTQLQILISYLYNFLNETITDIDTANFNTRRCLF